MGFKSVYRTLQELFPQVDARLLKAAAIEHSKDPDAAVEFILADVIPHTVEKFDVASSINGNLGSSVACERQGSSASTSSSKHESTAASETANESEDVNATHHMDPPLLSERLQDLLVSTVSDKKEFNDQLCGYAISKELTTSKTWKETHHETVQYVSAQDISVFPIIKDVDSGDSDLPTSDAVLDVSLNTKLINVFSPGCGLLSVNSNMSVHAESRKKQLNSDCDSLDGSNYGELAMLSVKDHTVESSSCSIQSNVEGVIYDSKLETSEVNCIGDSTLKEDIQVVDNASAEKSSSPHCIVTQSGQVYNTDLLENFIEESKSNKKKLLSDMESVLKLMKEVEFEENAAEQAKKEAGKGGLEICAKVEELKNMLNRATEANDMHSGEVYGERGILATEMKELQSRLYALSDLKDESLSILDVMRQALEARLAAAEMERNAAEQEIHVREESARKALAEQELVMEKVVQESKKLQREAEENARLREFLMDRGHVVDMLQGEISVICHDVKLLKEKFDNHIPLSESVSSWKTSCILSSSGSARKSTDEDQLLKHDKPSALYVEPLLIPSAEQTTVYIENQLSDEGWELFEDAAED